MSDYDAGWSAYFAGRDVGDNPHGGHREVDARRRKAWRRGWFDARDRDRDDAARKAGR